jgi:hypothetical protein
MMAPEHTDPTAEKLSNIDLQQVDGGTLVFEDDPDELGRRLIGFTDVADWSAVRDELAARGLGVGAVHQKEVYEPREVGL